MLASSEPTLELSAFLFSYSVRYDDRSRPVPDALREVPTVTNGDVSPDGLTLRYKLRPHMKWHDGAPLTCRDFRFTWRAVMNPKNNAISTEGFRDIKEIDCRDPLVAVIRMKHLYAPFLGTIFAPNGNVPILPEHLLARYNDDRGSLNSAPYNSAPIGSGPFRFVAWNRSSDVRLAAFADYYLGRPKLDKVIYKIMPDGNTLATQLQTHEVDLLFHGSGNLWARIRGVPGTRVVTPPIFSYTHLDFNLRRPVFHDARVRFALKLALDRRAMLDKIQHGLGELAETDQSPSLSTAYDPSVTLTPYDPVRARALLEAAGWRLGADGIRRRDGHRFAFTLSGTTESTTAAAVETGVQAYWRAIGAEVTVKNYPTTSFFDNTANGIIQGGKYDCATFSWSASADPDDSPIYSGENLAPKGQNALYWDDPQATAAMEDALKTVDMKRRNADYRVVQRRLASDTPTIILWFLHEPEVYNDDLKGFTATPVITTPFWNTWEYSI